MKKCAPLLFVLLAGCTTAKLTEKVYTPVRGGTLRWEENWATTGDHLRRDGPAGRKLIIEFCGGDYQKLSETTDDNYRYIRFQCSEQLVEVVGSDPK